MNLRGHNSAQNTTLHAHPFPVCIFLLVLQDSVPLGHLHWEAFLEFLSRS